MKNIAAMWWDVHNYYEISLIGVENIHDTISELVNSRMGTIGYIECAYSGRIFRVADLGTIGSTSNSSVDAPIGEVG